MLQTLQVHFCELVAVFRTNTVLVNFLIDLLHLLIDIDGVRFETQDPMLHKLVKSHWILVVFWYINLELLCYELHEGFN